MSEHSERPADPKIVEHSFKDKISQNLKKPVLAAAAAIATAGATYGVFKAADGGSGAKEVTDGNVKVERTAEGGLPSKTAVVISSTEIPTGAVDSEPVAKVTPIGAKPQEIPTKTTAIPTEFPTIEPEIALSARAVKIKDLLEKGYESLGNQLGENDPKLQKLLSDLADCDVVLASLPAELAAPDYTDLLPKCEGIGYATKKLYLKSYSNDFLDANEQMKGEYLDVAHKAQALGAITPSQIEDSLKKNFTFLPGI
jgi:hypothetical protein